MKKETAQTEEKVLAPQELLQKFLDDNWLIIKTTINVDHAKEDIAKSVITLSEATGVKFNVSMFVEKK